MSAPASKFTWTLDINCEYLADAISTITNHVSELDSLIAETDELADPDDEDELADAADLRLAYNRQLNIAASASMGIRMDEWDCLPSHGIPAQDVANTFGQLLSRIAPAVEPSNPQDSFNKPHIYHYPSIHY